MKLQQSCKTIWGFIVSGLSPLSTAGSIILPIIIMTLIGGIIAVMVSTNIMSGTATQDAAKRLDNAATAASEQMEDALSRSLGDAYALSQDSVLMSNEATSTEKLTEMKRVKTLYGTFEDIALVGLYGNVITSTDYKYYDEWDNNSLFQSAAHGNPAMADMASPIDNSTGVIHIAFPVVDTNQNITSVLLAQINTEYIWQTISRAKIEGAGSLYLVDESGDIIAGPDKSQLLKKIGFVNEDSPIPLPHQLIQYKDGDREMCAVIASVNPNVPWSGNKWSIVATLASADAFAAMRKAQTICYLVILTFLLLSLAGALALGHFLSRKVRTIARGTAQIAAGDLSYRLPPMLPNDFGQLADSFNSMAARLEASSTKIAKLNARLTGKDETKAREPNELTSGEIQSERLATIGYIAASVAHELNDPLNAISFYARLGAEESDKFHPPEEMPDTLRNTSEYFRNINKELQRTKDIMRRLVSFVRYSKTNNGAVNVNQILSDALAVTKHHLETHKVELFARLQADLPPVQGNTYKLQHVFLDMILNAQRAMPQGGKLTVETRLLDGNNHTIEVLLSETDGGIPSEKLDKIFKPLSSTETEGPDTRLDLSATHEIVKQFGGEIRAKSEIGTGTTFTISLPIADVPSPMNKVNSTPQPAEMK